jgi:hypothetical protein
MVGVTTLLLIAGQYGEPEAGPALLAAKATVLPAVPVAQVDFVMVVLFKVTAPFLARSLPLTVELPSSVIDVKASTFPIRVVEVPNVADDPTCQKTLQA